LSESSPLILLESVWRTYNMGGQPLHALADVSLTVQRAEYLAVVGASGSGKSTLMNLLGCLDTPSRGTYSLNGRKVSTMSDDDLAYTRNQEIGFVFQTFNLLSRQSALRNVELPLVYGGVPAQQRMDKARAVLERVGLADRMHHKPTELSGGQCQRVAVARALVTDPSLLLADEPTGNLDTSTGQEILSLFEQLHEEGNTIILVTHNPGVAEHTKRVVTLSDGRIEKDRLL